MTVIYVLLCQQGKYYVGKTLNEERRILEHFASIGSAWTHMYPPISVVAIYRDCDDLDEDKYTKMYMRTYGIDNVRGGSYSQVNLDPATKQFLVREICGADDRCFRCGKAGHFIASCTETTNANGEIIEDTVMQDAESNTCTRCGRNSHMADQCFARTHLDGRGL
jgi:predicted GIY-YIG superfamily endonuclease